ncbi:hypothetical protein Q4563_17985, partial [Gilvimarinus sp. 1_MG-2023]|nr:hypothetical protein [Gilvimarinus sp. 1_MG-2023]
MSTNTHVTSNIFVTLAAAIIVIAGVRSAADILVPFLLSVFIAVLSAPMMHWLSRRGVPDVLAVLLMMLG